MLCAMTEHWFSAEERTRAGGSSQRATSRSKACHSNAVCVFALTPRPCAHEALLLETKPLVKRNGSEIVGVNFQLEPEQVPPLISSFAAAEPSAAFETRSFSQTVRSSDYPPPAPCRSADPQHHRRAGHCTVLSGGDGRKGRVVHCLLRLDDDVWRAARRQGIQGVSDIRCVRGGSRGRLPSVGDPRAFQAVRERLSCPATGDGAHERTR